MPVVELKTLSLQTSELELPKMTKIGGRSGRTTLMTPGGDERQAREHIDELLQAADWHVCDMARKSGAESANIGAEIAVIFRKYSYELTDDEIGDWEGVPNKDLTSFFRCLRARIHS